MSKHGALTSAMGAAITSKLDKRGFNVYYDHGESSQFVGTITVSMEEMLSMGNRISQLDIAIVERSSNKAIALVEIEETEDTPKTLIGDIFAVLMGESIYLPQRKKTEVGEWTTLIVIGNGKDHEDKNQYIRDKAMMSKSAFGTENSKIGDIVVTGYFASARELEITLMKKIEDAIQRSI